MEILTNPQQTDKEFKRLIRNYSKYSWAVAWGSTSYSDGFELLKKNRAKIERLIVGIHFYQTHPDFISEFLNDKNVKFVMNPDGVFHPKLYLFENSNKDWECIIGSPNFTGPAFKDNSEVSVLLSSKDRNAVTAHEDISKTVERYWKIGSYLEPQDFSSYQDMWKRTHKSRNRLSGQYGSSRKAQKPPLDVDIFTMTWQDFFQKVKEDQEVGLPDRLKMLEKAKKLFESHKHFNYMDKDERRGIAGFGPNNIIKWHAFGSTSGAGKFKHAINFKNKHISLALDQIPLNGDITKNHYRKFVKEINKIEGVATGTGTRLLSVKRPDYFLCLNNKNKENLCKKFGIPKTLVFQNTGIL